LESEPIGRDRAAITSAEAKEAMESWRVTSGYIGYPCFKWLRCEAFEEVVDENVDKICRQRIPLAYPNIFIEVFGALAPILRRDVV
jgi:hypothetical protein